MVGAPAQQHMPEWREMVVQALTDPSWAHDWRTTAKARARGFVWPDIAKQFEEILVRKKAEKS
jgi:hypothetical protein